MGFKKVSIVLRRVHCYDTEDISRDEFYAAGATVPASDHSLQKATVTTPLSIRSGQALDFPTSGDNVLFSGVVPDDDMIALGLTFNDADFGSADVPLFLDAAAAAVGVAVGAAVGYFSGSAGAGAVATAICTGLPRAVTSLGDYIDDEDILVTVDKVVSVGEFEDGVHQFDWHFNHKTPAGTITERPPTGPKERVDWSQWSYAVSYEIRVESK